jgi:hypothetical protein
MITNFKSKNMKPILFLLAIFAIATCTPEIWAEVDEPAVEIKMSDVSPNSVDLIRLTPLPGKDISVGTASVLDEPKIAFVVGKTLYYVEFAKAYKSKDMEPAHMYSDIDYGIFGDLLVVRGFEGGGGYGGWLFLFHASRDRIRLLDVLSNNTVSNLLFDFFLAIGVNKSDNATFFTLPVSGKDGYALAKLYFPSPRCNLFVRISEKGFDLDLNPASYKADFEMLSQKPKKDSMEFRNYLIYGFITGAFTKYEITKKLTNVKQEDSGDILVVIDSLKFLNGALHTKEKLILKKIELAGGK